MISTKFYVVCSGEINSRHKYTISTRTDVCGWETDSGQCGYGLPREVAEWMVECLNQHQIPRNYKVTNCGEWIVGDES